MLFAELDLEHLKYYLQMSATVSHLLPQAMYEEIISLFKRIVQDYLQEIK